MALNIPFCLIGGVALQRWGETRMTVDADATVITNWDDDQRVTNLLLQHFAGRREDAREFALRYRVLLLKTSSSVSLDIALGALPFEARAVERSSMWKINDAQSLRTCSAEDLIVHKAFASRPQDWVDIESILIRQDRKLDVPLILRELTPLLDLKADTDILPRLKERLHALGYL